MPGYKRTLVELTSHAVLHWPDEILRAAGDMSVLPLLLKTQDAFISLLKLSDKTHLAWRDALGITNSLSGPVFLKHLMVLSDLGGEALNKLTPLITYFPEGVMKFDWQGRSESYTFAEIQDRCSLTNSSLKVDSRNLALGSELTPKMMDVCMLLIFGSQCSNDSLPTEVKDKCTIGGLLGMPEVLDLFVRENYIRVSKQVSGATANAQGQVAQDYVVNTLAANLPSDWKVLRNSTLTGVRHSIDGNPTTFDVVVKSDGTTEFGVEVSFQVTTNSTIERKARESGSLIRAAHAAGHKVCYVIDGAGNINIRRNAISTLCNNSDCTVAMSESEIQLLASYMKELA